MSPAIVVKDGSLAGQRFELGAETIVGRDSPGVTIDDAEMSRRHAVIRSRDAELEIEDLGSLNGTWVNGARIGASTRLTDGDVVKIGNTTFEVEAAARSAQTVASEQPVPKPAPQPAAAAAVSGPSDEPSEPFGTYAARKPARTRIASRQAVPTLVSYAAVLATAASLAVYFALR